MSAPPPGWDETVAHARAAEGPAIVMVPRATFLALDDYMKYIIERDAFHKSIIEQLFDQFDRKNRFLNWALAVSGIGCLFGVWDVYTFFSRFF